MECDGSYSTPEGFSVEKFVEKTLDYQNDEVRLAQEAIGLPVSTIKTVTQLRTEQGGVVEGYDDTWSIEIDENGSITSEDDPHDIISHRGYIITRNLSAKGRTYYDGGFGENNTAPNKLCLLYTYDAADE